MRVDAEFQREVILNRKEESGTTALAVAIFGSKMIVANAGDCRALLSRNSKALELTTDHRPNCANERMRIEEAGGYVDLDGYLCGDLGVSRAIGDHHYFHLKKNDGSGPLIAEPEVVELEIEPDDEFVVILSDGVTDCITSQTIVDLIRDSLRKLNCPDAASKAIVEAAYKTGVRDNLTALTICLKEDPPCKAHCARATIGIDRKSKSFANLIKALEQ